MEGIEGKCVEWTRELAYLGSQVFGGLSIGMKHRQAALTYDVLVDAPSSEKERLMTWKQGKRYIRIELP